MTEQQRLFAQLSAFLAPMANVAGLKLRPFSINLFSMTRLAGLSVGSKEFASLPDETKERQLAALLVMQTEPDAAALGAAIRAAAGDFEKFYWDFVFPRALAIPVEALELGQAQIAADMAAIEASQVDVIVPPSMKGDGEKPPGN